MSYCGALFFRFTPFPLTARCTLIYHLPVPVAVKLASRLGVQDALPALLKNEASVMLQLVHSNLVHCFAVSTTMRTRRKHSFPHLRRGASLTPPSSSLTHLPNHPSPRDDILPAQAKHTLTHTVLVLEYVSGGTLTDLLGKQTGTQSLAPLNCS
jgi:serine/threonine protein kinase